jgi:hypothetical protein
MWAFNCDFYGNDIGNQPSSSEDCGGICVSNPSCTHFSWGNGVCYLKKADHPTASDLNGAVCGWVTNRPPSGGKNIYLNYSLNDLKYFIFYSLALSSDSSGSKVSAKATFWAEHSDSGGCQMLGNVNYAVTDALALGQQSNLGYLVWQQGLCGQVLNVDCGKGSVNAVVASTCNLGSGSCGVDLIGKTWRTLTGNQSPGETQCQVSLSTQNPIDGSGPFCFYRPNSPTDNPYYTEVGVLNTNGRIPSSANLAGVDGRKNSGDGYFSFNSSGLFSKDATVTFNFQDGSTALFQLRNCASGSQTHIF